MKTALVLTLWCAFCDASLSLKHKPPALSPQPSDGINYFWYNNVTFVSQYNHPEEDIGVFDEAHKRTYWVVKSATGQTRTTWDKPAELDWHAQYDELSGNYFFRNNQLDLTTWSRPACLAWSKRSLDNAFYYNSVTKEAVWPNDLPEYVPFENDSGDKFWHDKRTKVSTYEPPSVEAAWYTAESDAHIGVGGKLRQYYYNAKTKLSTWELPAHSNIAWKKSYAEIEL